MLTKCFSQGSLFGPYTPLQLLDVLGDSGTKSFIAGSTNPLLLQQRNNYSDILINVSGSCSSLSSFDDWSWCNSSTTKKSTSERLCWNRPYNWLLPTRDGWTTWFRPWTKRGTHVSTHTISQSQSPGAEPKFREPHCANNPCVHRQWRIHSTSVRGILACTIVVRQVSFVYR